VRNTALELQRTGVDTTIVSGSYDMPDLQTAEVFYGKTGAQIISLDYTAGLNSPDPRLTNEPVQYSYEHKPDAPDVLMLSVDDASYERTVAHWMEAFERAKVAEAQIIHLNHVSPMNEAILRLQQARKLHPKVHVIGSFHGTEFLALENYAMRCAETGKHE